MRLPGLLALLLLLALPAARAATISGVVYDLSLTKVTTAIVSINTDQPQRQVTSGGGYSFHVPSGDYTLKANATLRGVAMRAEENVTVREDGEYVLDMILAPALSADKNLTISNPAPQVAPRHGWGLAALSLLALLAAAAGILLWTRQQRPALRAGGSSEDDEFRDAVLRVLRESHGRATQKEIRRAVSFSEAKVSLVLSELEDEGLVRKIKRGRGNVIVMK